MKEKKKREKKHDGEACATPRRVPLRDLFGRRKTRARARPIFARAEKIRGKGPSPGAGKGSQAPEGRGRAPRCEPQMKLLVAIVPATPVMSMSRSPASVNPFAPS